MFPWLLHYYFQYSLVCYIKYEYKFSISNYLIAWYICYSLLLLLILNCLNLTPISIKENPWRVNRQQSFQFKCIFNIYRVPCIQFTCVFTPAQLSKKQVALLMFVSQSVCYWVYETFAGSGKSTSYLKSIFFRRYIYLH